jgi:hypothetical protein
MTSTADAKKAALIRQAAALAGETLDPAEEATAKRVISEFY